MDNNLHEHGRHYVNQVHRCSCGEIYISAANEEDIREQFGTVILLDSGVKPAGYTLNIVPAVSSHLSLMRS